MRMMRPAWMADHAGGGHFRVADMSARGAREALHFSSGESAMPHDAELNIDQALGQIPSGLFVLTSSHDGMRSGALTQWVQMCSEEPPLVMVSMAKGLAVEPLVRDSRGFALCQISDGDRLLVRKFNTPPERGDDPFVALPARIGTCSGAPIIERAMSYLECELVRHMDLDTGFRLYVGQIRSGEVIHAEATPAVVIGANGYHMPPNGSNGGANGAGPNGQS
jgi:flavin reductase (DIM6/NTAB) family NADH-FMN oxidoreductase RutF